MSPTANWSGPIVQPYTRQNIPRYLHGTIPPMATPCTPEHTIDEVGTRSYIDFLIDDQKIDTLFVRGGIGRMYAFNYDQVRQLNEIVVDHVSDRVPIISGTCGVWSGNIKNKPDPDAYTRETIELTNHADEVGVTAAVVVLPSALDAAPDKSLEDTMVDHYVAVAADTDLPIVLYQPGAHDENYWLKPSLLRKLIDRLGSRISGVKISSSTMNLFTENALVAEGTNFGFIAGDERAFMFTMFVGAVGVIGRGCNMYPEIIRSVYDRMMDGDVHGAREAQLDVIRALGVTGGMDTAISSLEYARRKGADVQPYTLVPSSVVDEEFANNMEQALDLIRADYLV
jgi:4-hydroxy-tetrahydrodipicolinate synthase